MRIVLCVAMLCLGAVSPAQADLRDVEYELKAAVLVKLMGFVELPKTVQKTESVASVIAILGKDPFGARLDRQLGSVHSKSKAHNIVHFPDLKSMNRYEGSFDVVFIALSDEARVREALEQFSEKGVLTVADTESFCKQGGMISLLKRNNRLHFEININAARQAGLRISSKLLALATIVEAEQQRGDH